MSQFIIYPTDNDGVAIVIPATECGLTIEEIASKDVPAGKPYKIVGIGVVPSDGTFRNAWEYGESVTINLDKAKAIGHDMRRAARAEEFAPYDKIIAAQIPGQSAADAEAARAAIRAKYAIMQTAIDAAASPDEIKSALGAAS